jgi:hypothetical protein
MLDKIASGCRRARRIRQERAGTHYAPQYAHLPAPYSHMIRHMDGSVFAMHEVEGASWEDLDEGGLAALHERLCSLHRTLALRSSIVITK